MTSPLDGEVLPHIQVHQPKPPEHKPQCTDPNGTCACRYRIAWERRDGRHDRTQKGAGTKLLPYTEADLVVQELNQDYPMIHHWVELV